MSSYLVQEVDGVSRFVLEDGTGFILLEDSVPPGGGDIPAGGGPIPKGMDRRRRALSDDDWLAVVLGEV